MTNWRMVRFGIPEDSEILRAIGIVAVRHAQLEYVLRMMVKSLKGLPIQEGLKATFREGPAKVRDRIEKLARKRFGEGKTLNRLFATLKECKKVTERRNEHIHSFVAQEVDPAGEITMQTDSDGAKPLPSAEELKSLAEAVIQLAEGLNRDRLHGYLKEAMDLHPCLD